MQKYTYQTSLRMSEKIKDAMTEVCDRYQINESDFIRHSVAKNLENHLNRSEPERDSFLTFAQDFIPSVVVQFLHTNLISTTGKLKVDTN